MAGTVLTAALEHDHCRPPAGQASHLNPPLHFMTFSAGSCPCYLCLRALQNFEGYRDGEKYVGADMVQRMVQGGPTVDWTAIDDAKLKKS